MNGSRVELQGMDKSPPPRLSRSSAVLSPVQGRRSGQILRESIWTAQAARQGEIQGRLSSILCRHNRLKSALAAFFVLAVFGGVASSDDAHGTSFARRILKARPLAPSDITLFSPGAYPDAPPLVPAAGDELDIDEADSALDNYFKKESHRNQQRALKIFYDEDAMEKIPSHSLRAALTGLLGTAGEPAIHFILKAKTPEGLPKVQIIGFGVPEEWEDDPATARVIVDINTQQMSIVFNPKYKAENPFLFSSVLAHEALHSDNSISTTEEVILLALDISIYLEQLARHPELAASGTELSRRRNTNALARLNSGIGAELGLFASNGNQPILPGSVVPATSWFGQFENNPGFGDTPGSPLLRQILTRLGFQAFLAENLLCALESLTLLSFRH